ncbi:DUF2894 domain-containing protein [Burkholderia mayonis]|uniref:DUF2894 domain-containing protein n=1 Tax=Burkholderia mayonis TaxID=1385591 RepID=A0A1B4FUH4_9BURK|nr:DUF2894 domain-containing protein [Burkholderia mayonis]AOJ07330.1 hypothetical protein WS71_08420 [Burkholderia mayonis]KVE45816.1 hypothetical protein WS71_23490 [Burkholderia mayonis]
MSATNNAAAHARETLDAWRARGADRLDPVRFRFIDALLRRTAGQTGDARRILDTRLSALLDAYADDLQRAESKADARERAAATPMSTSMPTPMSPSMPAEAARGPLAALLDYIGSQERPDDGGPAAGAAGSAANRSRLALRPEPEMLAYFREIWSRVSADSQLRESLEQVPRNAGPLNSSSLVHRSLSLMRELSPEYLRQFLSYVDALSWLAQMNGDEAAAGDDAARGGSAKKSGRKKSR